MRLIAIDLLTEGMMVAKPVLRDGGQILLAPGVLLTGRMIERLKSQSVGQVWVEAEGPDEGRLSAEAAKEMERTLERRFAHVSHDPLMQQIQEIVRKRIRARAEGETHR
jgi:hypothetical protein